MYKKIKAFCDNVGISVAQFERICGTSHGYMDKLARSKPGIRTAVRIAQVMGITVEELLGDDDE